MNTENYLKSITDSIQKIEKRRLTFMDGFRQGLGFIVASALFVAIIVLVALFINIFWR